MKQKVISESMQAGISERSIQVVFELSPRGTCFMDHLEGEVSDVELHFPNGECHSDVTLCREDETGRCVEVLNHTGDICTNCPGTVFGEYDLVPHFKERNENGFVVQANLSSNRELSDLVADLRTVSEFVRILRIVDVLNNQADDVTGEVDFTQLTEKQRSAREGATRAGYYGPSQDVSLDELAAEFDISTSALSQRLARAEQQVFSQLFGREK